jgi:ABC-2 type transport system ATP-binding protein
MAKPIISTSDLTKFYGKSRGIEKLTLEVNEGEVFGFLGPNGAGKSTTIKLLLNFILPTSGSAKIFSLDSTKQITEILNEVGYLPGEIHMYEDISGSEHLKFQAKLRNNVDWDYVQELTKRLKVDLSKRIKSLSHGNKQKVALIGAFMHKPKLIILDEPTTGLDPLIQQEFYRLVDEVNKSGTTFFISSHILPEIERICDRVAIIKEGKLVLTEEIETLKKTALRPLEVIFSQKVQKTDFNGISGIKDLEINENILQCKVVGSLDEFVKKLASYKVESIITQEPDLEQIFLKYYKGES